MTASGPPARRPMSSTSEVSFARRVVALGFAGCRVGEHECRASTGGWMAGQDWRATEQPATGSALDL